jgi:hypothetical protein
MTPRYGPCPFYPLAPRYTHPAHRAPRQQQAFATHMGELCSLYGNQILFSLIDGKGYETKVGAAFDAVVKRAADRRIRYAAVPPRAPTLAPCSPGAGPGTCRSTFIANARGCATTSCRRCWMLPKKSSMPRGASLCRCAAVGRPGMAGLAHAPGALGRDLGTFSGMRVERCSGRKRRWCAPTAWTVWTGPTSCSRC